MTETEKGALSRRGKPKRSVGLAERSVSVVELQAAKTIDPRVPEMVRGRGFEPLNPYGTGS